VVVHLVLVLVVVLVVLVLVLVLLHRAATAVVRVHPRVSSCAAPRWRPAP
jgi:hypothetical protein